MNRFIAHIDNKIIAYEIMSDWHLTNVGVWCLACDGDSMIDTVLPSIFTGKPLPVSICTHCGAITQLADDPDVIIGVDPGTQN